MKKTFILILTLCMAFCGIFAFGGCSPKADITIGISKYVNIPALNDAEDGFIEEFNRLIKGAGKTVRYSQKEASGEQAQANNIAGIMASQGVDLIYAIATPSAISAASATADNKLPVVATAVTDFNSEKLLENGNVTGTSDMNPIDKQYELIKMLVPTVKKVGFLRMANEKNSIVQRDILKAYCDVDGVELVDKSVTDRNDIEAIFKQLSDCDVIYLPTDNTISNASPNIMNINKESIKKPIVWGEIGPHLVSGVATYGIDYKELGKLSAKMAFDILINGKKPGDIPVQKLENYKFSLNEEVANQIGFTIPDAVKALANK
ncbi:MAG: ABC transporter substrate-binding protein [Clostridia bacterium]